MEVIKNLPVDERVYLGGLILQQGWALTEYTAWHLPLTLEGIIPIGLSGWKIPPCTVQLRMLDWKVK